MQSPQDTTEEGGDAQQEQRTNTTLRQHVALVTMPLLTMLSRTSRLATHVMSTCGVAGASKPFHRLR